MAEVACRQFVVKGRVQGVGFRWFAVRAAEQLGVVGWVRNCDDGSVEVVARGTPESLLRLEADLRRGPEAARVTDVTVSEIQHEAVEGNSFSVKH
jgi:acylphosphatase